MKELITSRPAFQEKLKKVIEAEGTGYQMKIQNYREKEQAIKDGKYLGFITTFFL